MTANLVAAWIGFLLGCVSGAVTGTFFYREDWLGGYASWRRRMTRLGHISFFGLGFLNLAFVFSARAAGLESELTAASVLMILGAASMPAVCFLSAWRAAARHLFFIPVLALTGSVVLLLWKLVTL